MQLKLLSKLVWIHISFTNIITDNAMPYEQNNSHSPNHLQST